jgi:hypothetical protein
MEGKPRTRNTCIYVIICVYKSVLPWKLLSKRHRPTTRMAEDHMILLQQMCEEREKETSAFCQLGIGPYKTTQEFSSLPLFQIRIKNLMETFIALSHFPPPTSFCISTSITHTHTHIIKHSFLYPILSPLASLLFSSFVFCY